MNEERLEKFMEEFEALSVKYGIGVVARVFLTEDGRISAEVVPVNRLVPVKDGSAAKDN